MIGGLVYVQLQGTGRYLLSLRFHEDVVVVSSPLSMNQVGDVSPFARN